jgi:DNA-binding response OmpR family regulator
MTSRRQLGHVLVIQPDVVLRRATASTVSILGMVSSIADVACARDARALLAQRAYDAVVIDLDEGPSAAELLGNLREGAFATARTVPVLATCSAAARTAGAHDVQTRVLHKPLRVKDLLVALDGVMQPTRISPASPSP